MHSDKSKQYMLVNEKPLIYYTVKAFCNSKVDEIILVVGKDDIEYVKNDIINEYFSSNKIKLVAGGKERFDSAYNGVLAAQQSDYVLIHDGARPCIKPDLIDIIINSVKEKQACVPAIPVKDTIKVVNTDKEVIETPDRNILWQVQTPQAFKIDIIKEAYMKMMESTDKSITDDAMVVERYSDYKVYIVDGDNTNIKVTTPEDMIMVNKIL